MERIITIKGKVGLYDIPCFTYADNEPLKLRFNTKKLAVGKYIAVVMCGENKKTVYLGDDMAVELPPSFLANGEAVYVSLELRNNRTDTIIISGDASKGGFLIEPLKLDRVEEYTTAQAWMQKLEGDITALKEELSAVKSKLEQFEDEGVPLLAETENE
jgi:hypothetical protein